MRYLVLTLFPDMIEAVVSASILGRARQQGIIEVDIVNIRDFARDRHRTVDDYPYGGGAGMVMKADVVVEAVREARRKMPQAPVLYLSPQGQTFTQNMAKSLAREPGLILLCGHYEGMDERVMDYVDKEISIGDYVLTGGELPALVLIDAVSRLLPGVLGDEASPYEESFTDGLLEYPQYTRPYVFENKKVPEVLISGHHANIRRWRLKMSLFRTLMKRPDLLLGREYTDEERELLSEILFGKKEDGNVF